MTSNNNLHLLHQEESRQYDEGCQKRTTTMLSLSFRSSFFLGGKKKRTRWLDKRKCLKRFDHAKSSNWDEGVYARRAIPAPIRLSKRPDVTTLPLETVARVEVGLAEVRGVPVDGTVKVVELL